MSAKKGKVITSIYLTEDMCNQIDKRANKLHKPRTELIRDFISKGLEVEGYTQDINFIADIVRQEVKSQLAPQIERLVKILMKSGKISAGLYYLTLKLYLRLASDEGYVSIKELATQTRKLGIKYMQYKDHEINQYLEDDNLVFNDLDRI